MDKDKIFGQFLSEIISTASPVGYEDRLMKKIVEYMFP